MKTNFSSSLLTAPCWAWTGQHWLASITLTPRIVLLGVVLATTHAKPSDGGSSTTAAGQDCGPAGFCGPHASCVRLCGDPVCSSVVCHCDEGYAGEGRECTPTHDASAAPELPPSVPPPPPPLYRADPSWQPQFPVGAHMFSGVAAAGGNVYITQRGNTSSEFSEIRFLDPQPSWIPARTRGSRDGPRCCGRLDE